MSSEMSWRLQEQVASAASLESDDNFHVSSFQSLEFLSPFFDGIKRVTHVAFVFMYKRS